eukprot:TRINITY_DN3877_c0_g1_i2.p1 TRINITY_DN3877_c0_g1~~TRINITY_DN3877_c0_g1_i2.p1  ORF type:complete len:389 (-),score=74.55 TRINITY_DN3877_c0_g1_i2:268-1434(-)
MQHSPLTFTSDEVNYLIYRYLKESGFEHTCFTFAYESRVLQSTDFINPHDVKPGSLINVIQKGLQYMEVEAHVKEDGLVIECDQPISLVKPHKCTPIDSMELDMYSGGTHIPESLVTTLEGHTSEVFNCAWNPKYSLLASGSGDGTARLWKIMDGLCGRGASEEASRTAISLNHSTDGDNSNCHITTLDWSNEGTMLATGSYDGVARIWDWRGDLILSLKKHKGSIFSLKWSPDNQYLLSGSFDRSAIVWDVKTGHVVQQFEAHRKAALDVDWKDNNTFATCSSDTNIFVWEIGQTESTKMFRGHTNEVNAIRWDPQGRLLASCSDDTTAKIWSMESDSPLYDLTDHTKEIYTVKWSPTGPGSANPNRNLVLARFLKILLSLTSKCLF